MTFDRDTQIQQLIADVRAAQLDLDNSTNVFDRMVFEKKIESALLYLGHAVFLHSDSNLDLFSGADS